MLQVTGVGLCDPGASARDAMMKPPASLTAKRTARKPKRGLEDERGKVSVTFEKRLTA